ncbi:MAG: hypothetical protein H7X95_01405 [Deltaproteobacteria bacterium]|nr:hypothetical protein [Deltaproteobacteria bacterium]
MTRDSNLPNVPTDPTVPTGGSPPRRDTDVHVGDLKLRCFLAGESNDADRVRIANHAATCVTCTRRLDALRDEQRAFEDRISFDRFAAGVGRAARVPAPTPGLARTSARTFAGVRIGTGAGHWWRRPASTRSFVAVFSVGSLAAALALVVGVRPLFESARVRRETIAEADRISNADRAAGRNRVKGAASDAAVLVRVASAHDPSRQRTVATEAPEPLAVGERIRIGVQGDNGEGGDGAGGTGKYPFMFVISIDDHGIVTPLYPQTGASIPLPQGAKMQFLPDSLELTGKGAERLVVLLTQEPLQRETVNRAVATAFVQSGGDLHKLRKLAVVGEQFHRTFIKP